MVQANIHQVADKETEPPQDIARDIASDIYSDAAWDLFLAELHDSSRPDDPPALFATPAAERLLSLAFEFGPQTHEAVSR